MGWFLGNCNGKARKVSRVGLLCSFFTLTTFWQHFGKHRIGYCLKKSAKTATEAKKVHLAFKIVDFMKKLIAQQK